MVALLRHQPPTDRPGPAAVDPRLGPPALRLVTGELVDQWNPGSGLVEVAEADAGASGVGRPQLQLIHGVPGAGVWPSAGVLAAIALVVFGLFGLVRVAQGSPGAGAGAEAGVGVAGSEAAAVAVPGPGDRVIVAGPGDSLWSIAVALSPDTDPRPLVASLIEANGGETVRIGQQIVIPAGLLD